MYSAIKEFGGVWPYVSAWVDARNIVVQSAIVIF